MQHQHTAFRLETAAVISQDGLTGTLMASWLGARLGFSKIVRHRDVSGIAAGAAAPALILLDLQRMRYRGAPVVQTLRQRFGAARIVVVADLDRAEDAFALVRAGATAVADRTCPEAELIHVARAALEGVVSLPGWVSGTASTAPRAPSGPQLTPRQREVLQLLVEGRSNKQIAQDLSLAEGTVKYHVAALLRRLKVSCRAAASARGAALFGCG